MDLFSKVIGDFTARRVRGGEDPTLAHHWQVSVSSYASNPPV